MKGSNLLLGILFCAKAGNGQTAFRPATPSARLSIKASKASQKIVLDGKLNEADWQLCENASGFIQSQPDQGTKATFGTTVKVLYDDVNIYIGAICDNPTGKVYVQDLRRDFTYNDNDLFGVFIDPFKDVQSPVQSFLVTPLSTQRDLLIYDDRIYDLNWDAVWKAKSTITPNNWSVEIAIPWSTLRYPSDSTSWAINFNRNIRGLNQITGWSPWPLAYSVGRMAYSGLITDIHPPKTKMNIRV
ncbi:MAG: carbohydrate binding family 9 domain-containing protein, partial [Ferruginibacter sp.]